MPSEADRVAVDPAGAASMLNDSRKQKLVAAYAVFATPLDLQ